MPEATIMSPSVMRSAMIAGFRGRPQTLSKAERATIRALSAQKRVTTRNGEIIDLGHDHDVQLKAADQVYAIAGIYAPKATAERSSNSAHITVNIASLDASALHTLLTHWQGAHQVLQSLPSSTLSNSNTT